MNSMEIKKLYPNRFQIPQDKHIKAVIQKEYLIEGKIKKHEGPRQKVYSPIMINEKDGIKPYFLGEYPLMDKNQALKALESAQKAYSKGSGLWPTMRTQERISCVENFLSIMKTKREEIINILMWEIGKSFSDSAKEFDRTVEYVADTINALKELDRNSSRFSFASGIYGQIKRSPLGVVLCMGPYNYPLNETFTTLIPALIMGNTVIFKPPKFGVLLHKPLIEAFAKSFPPGVVNTIYGDGKEIITPLMGSGKIDVLAFIGSSKVADILKKLHPYPHRLRCVLGLDAKNAAIILQDADIENAAKECATGALSFNGQRCTALKIIFIHKKIKKQFTETFISKISNLKAGMPWENGVFLTPIPDDSRINYFEELIKDAQKKGAKIINDNGGSHFGTFFYPAVISQVNEDMRLWREEQFGPVIPITYFDSIKEPLEYVINSNFGQQVSIFGRDSSQIASLTDILVNQVSRVNLNSQCQRGPDIFPFTGRKDSAEGTLSVSDALRVFSIRALFAFKDSNENKKTVDEILKKGKSKFLSTDYIF
ncbi:MAG: NADP-dependent glyceraldehyde-3-phosphate dehydrogenase [Elusimicrobia bacterium]|nr:NADP-dependent glyceraldehyde-3-phosphate dehydrogenase [Elusimicrobiota bacterium]